MPLGGARDGIFPILSAALITYIPVSTGEDDIVPTIIREVGHHWKSDGLAAKLLGGRHGTVFSREKCQTLPAQHQNVVLGGGE